MGCSSKTGPGPQTVCRSSLRRFGDSDLAPTPGGKSVLLPVLAEFILIRECLREKLSSANRRVYTADMQVVLGEGDLDMRRAEAAVYPPAELTGHEQQVIDVPDPDQQFEIEPTVSKVLE